MTVRQGAALRFMLPICASAASGAATLPDSTLACGVARLAIDTASARCGHDSFFAAF